MKSEKPIIIRPEAEEDIREGFYWYEECSKGLGSDFILSIDACLYSIKRFPEMYPKVYKNIRRTILKRFPFGIFYIIEEKRIAVIAVMHCSRHPKNWGKRG